MINDVCEFKKTFYKTFYKLQIVFFCSSLLYSTKILLMLVVQKLHKYKKMTKNSNAISYFSQIPCKVYVLYICCLI